MKLEVGVKAFITNSQGNYLLLKRAQPYPGETEPRWDIPGGRIIVGETLAQALAREIKEETNLTMTGEPKLIQAQDILRVSDKHTVRLTYQVSATGEVKLDPEEHSEFTWVPLEKIQNLHHDIYLTPVLETIKNLRAASSAG
ncbi:MAG: NUDIX hydrolase [Candidatus Kerfeldbacteria bacterium]|nr:NUDIX hydrolase [Candidatus Kerfeldbacteria bacterium]